jgi:WD40-like Beta Propeller Repeat
MRSKVDITNQRDCKSVPTTPEFDRTYDQQMTMPRFSPDGETIYFIGQYILGPDDKIRGLYSVPTGGGEATRIPIVNGDESPRVIGTYALSHDGSTFAISGAGVSRVPVSGGLPRRVGRSR